MKQLCTLSKFYLITVFIFILVFRINANKYHPFSLITYSYRIDNEAPSIIQEPGDSTLCEGESLVFIVIPAGTSPLSYQWYKNDTILITGAIDSIFTINGVSESDTGKYKCIVSNSFGSTTSNNATLRVDVVPMFILIQPLALLQCPGDSLEFAAGTVPSYFDDYTYKWFKNDTLIEGATNETYKINHATTSDVGSYLFVATNACGNDTSNTGRLNIEIPPVITQQPISVTSCQSSATSLNLNVTGTDLIYEWEKYADSTWTLVSTDTLSALTFNSVTLADTGTYRCIVSNNCNIVTSDSVTFKVKPVPIISQQPESLTSCQSLEVSFSVSATGTNLEYQWYKNDNIKINGAYQNILFKNNASPNDSGNYKCLITKESCSITSNNATLTVNKSPKISVQPDEGSQCIGGSYTFKVTTSDSSTVNYQWTKIIENGELRIENATNSLYTVNSCQSSDAGEYYCIINNSNCSVTSKSALFQITSAQPLITRQLAGDSVCRYTMYTFNIGVSKNGTSPLSFQWLKNDTTIIGGAIDSIYTIYSTDSIDNGRYRCIVINACGSVTSDEATLNASPNTHPIITTISGKQEKLAGDSTLFSVTVEGTEPFTYQWTKKIEN